MKRRILASAGKAGKTSENNGTEQKPERLKSSRRKSIPLKPGDFALTALVMMLVIFGVIMVFSASYYYAISKEGTPYYYLIRDIIWAVVGTAAMMFMAVFDYHKTQKMAIPVLGVVIVLLLLVFTPLGVTINNATRWIGVGGATIMPGELAKPACILFVAAWLSHPRHSIRSFVRGVLPPLLVAGVAGVLIAMQPSTTTAATLIIIVFGMMFIAGMSWAYVGGAFGLAVAAFAALIVTDDSGYRMKRILSFTDPFADPQGTGRRGPGKEYAEDALPSGTAERFYPRHHRGRAGIYRFVNTSHRLSPSDLEMHSYRPQCPGYVRYTPGIGHYNYAGRSGGAQRDDRNISHAADGNFTSFRQLGRKLTAGIYGQHGGNVKHFKTFDKIMESEL